jgi:hypothetical protein
VVSESRRASSSIVPAPDLKARNAALRDQLLG